MVQDHRRGTKTLLLVTITDLYHGYGPGIASRSGDRVSVSWKEKVVTVQQPKKGEKIKSSSLSRRAMWPWDLETEIRNRYSVKNTWKICTQGKGKKMRRSQTRLSENLGLVSKFGKSTHQVRLNLSDFDTNRDFEGVECGSSRKKFTWKSYVENRCFWPNIDSGSQYF